MTHPRFPAPALRADVVIPVYADVDLTRACIESVLRLSGDALARLILVDDCGPDAGMRPMLRAFRDAESRVHLLENATNLGFVGTANRGLAICEGHAVVLNSDARVTEGWLAEMLRVLGGSERIAAVSPLSNNGTLCSVPDFGASGPEDAVRRVVGRLDALPQWTEMPTGNGFCLLMRDTARAALGLFDPAYGRGYNEENDWCQRARTIGMVIARANRAFVFHRGEVSFAGARKLLDLRNSQRLVARYPSYLAENRAFEGEPEAHLAASAARAILGRLRLALHSGVHQLPGGEPLVSLLREDPRFESVRPQSQERFDLLLAPLHHASESDARATLTGTGRLVTLVDACRPARFGWQRSLQLLQLHASEAVIVPSGRAAGWVRSLHPAARVLQLPWPVSAALRGQPVRGTPRTRALCWEPSPGVRGLFEEALERCDAGPSLTALSHSDPAPARHRILREARLLLDVGGTPAGLLAEAAALGVPVLGVLLGERGGAAPQGSQDLGPQGLSKRISALLMDPVPPAAVPSGSDVSAAWGDALVEVATSPDGQIAKFRAALQAL